tara:strand:+ start:3710 stop:4228 length:519 start_codon:yes stop_codon:yes gene_type:complete
MERKDPLFDAPIPGQSMLHELGARPWQNPPQYTTLEEVVDFYVSKMATDEVAVQIADILEMDVSVVDLAHTMQLANVMEGVHTIDVGVLVTPVLMEFIMLIGDSAKVKYRTGLEEQDENVRDAMVKKAMRKFKEEEKRQDEMPTEETTPVAEEPKEEADTMSNLTGLMARRQ